MMAIDWFRSWHGAPTDAKWIVVARYAGPGVTPGHVAAVWWYMLDFASQNTPRGSLDGFDAEVCAASYGWPDDVVARIHQAMISKRIIDGNGCLSQWTKRNPKREDNSTERVKTWRETQRNAVKRNVTLDKSREEKKREDKKQNTTAADAAFEEFRNAYPKRLGGNPWPRARKCWNARLREGVPAEQMLSGVKRYAAYLKAIHKTGSEYVKQAATFLGPDKHWEEEWAVPAEGKAVPKHIDPISGKPYQEGQLDVAGTHRWLKGDWVPIGSLLKVVT